MTTKPPWAERSVTSVNLTRTSRERSAELARQLGCSRSDIVDAILRAYSMEELRSAIRLVQTEDGAAYRSWSSGSKS